MNDDHTKVEVEKYFIDGTEKKLLSGAVFTLYEAMLDDDGDVVWEKGKPMYYEDRPVDNWMSGDGSEYAGFVPAFEAV